MKIQRTLSLDFDDYDRFRKISQFEGIAVSTYVGAWIKEFIRRYDEKHAKATENLVSRTIETEEGHLKKVQNKVCPECGAEFAASLSSCPQCQSTVGKS